MAVPRRDAVIHGYDLSDSNRCNSVTAVTTFCGPREARVFCVDSDAPACNIVALIIAALSLKDRFEILEKGQFNAHACWLPAR